MEPFYTGKLPHRRSMDDSADSENDLPYLDVSGLDCLLETGDESNGGTGVGVEGSVNGHVEERVDIEDMAVMDEAGFDVQQRDGTGVEVETDKMDEVQEKEREESDIDLSTVLQDQGSHFPHRAGQKGHPEAHVNTMHSGQILNSSPLCEYTFGYEISLRSQTDAVHEDLQKYPCPHCKYEAGWKSNLQRHIDTVHEGQKKYSCPHCRYRTGDKSNLQIHIDTVHEGQKKYSCPHCQYRTDDKSNLQKHIDTVHEGQKKYSCPHCRYRTGDKSNLQKHIDTVHEGQKKYSCPHCQYRTDDKSNFRRHIDTVHEGQKKYSCPHCQYRTGDKSNLQKHIRRVHANRIVVPLLAPSQFEN